MTEDDLGWTSILKTIHEVESKLLAADGKYMRPLGRPET